MLRCEKIQDKKREKVSSVFIFGCARIGTLVRSVCLGRNISFVDANTPMTHDAKRVTLSNLYQSDDPNVNKQVLKNLLREKKYFSPLV